MTKEHRNVLAKVNRANGEMVAAAIRTIFAQPTADAVFSQFDRIVDTLAAQFPDVTAMLTTTRHDLLAFTAFPIEHWRNACSIHAAVLVSDEDAGVPGMTPLDSAFVASASQCLPGDPRLAAVA